jgi:hypothetical protein
MDGQNSSSYYYLPLKILLAWTLVNATMAEKSISFVGGGSNTNQWSQQC